MLRNFPFCPPTRQHFDRTLIVIAESSVAQNVVVMYESESGLPDYGLNMTGCYFVESLNLELHQRSKCHSAPDIRTGLSGVEPTE